MWRGWWLPCNLVWGRSHPNYGTPKFLMMQIYKNATKRVSLKFLFSWFNASSVKKMPLVSRRRAYSLLFNLFLSLWIKAISFGCCFTIHLWMISKQIFKIRFFCHFRKSLFTFSHELFRGYLIFVFFVSHSHKILLEQ